MGYSEEQCGQSLHVQFLRYVDKTSLIQIFTTNRIYLLCWFDLKNYILHFYNWRVPLMTARVEI